MALYHQLEGEGAPLVLVHAGICDSRMWDRQWLAFVPGHRLLRYDMRGFGRSPIASQPFSHAADLAELLDAQGITAAVVVGVSLGGRVALELAVARPDLVSKLVLSGAGLPDHEWSQAVREYAAAEDAAVAAGDLDAACEINVRFWVDGKGRPSGTADPAVRREVHEMQRRALELQIAAGDAAEEVLLVADVGSRLGEVAAPALVVIGEHDVADMHQMAHRIAAALPNARRGLIAGAAHLPSMERADEFDRLVLGFLSVG